MNAEQILAELEPLGSENYRRILQNHGIAGPMYGVKIQELKKYEKMIKKNYDLSRELYETGVYDAMYLAGLIADEKKMTKEDLRQWLDQASSDAIAEYAVAWVAADTPHGWDLALEWIESPDEKSQIVGWGTLSSLVCVWPDSELDIPKLRSLIAQVRDTIHSQPDRIRYKMNGFVISVGCSVPELKQDALDAAEAIGKVNVEMGKTACKVPGAGDYIRKVESMGRIGKKRKTARC